MRGRRRGLPSPSSCFHNVPVKGSLSLWRTIRIGQFFLGGEGCPVVLCFVSYPL